MLTKALCLASSAAVLVTARPAVAQDVSAPVTAPAAAVAPQDLAHSDSRPQDQAASTIAAVGDIIVTARKRAETVQTVPLSIQAVSQATITEKGVASLLDLASVAPGVNITRAPNEDQVGITLRGLGTNAGVPSFDSSVSLFVDGVYAPRSREFSASLFDVERVEVISGTQAALLGKNTSLGAVNIITRKPGDRFAVDATASYEFELGTPRLTGGVDLPISDTLKVRVSGLTEDSMGWVRNLATHDYGPEFKNDAVRGVVVWKPAAGLDLTAVAQHFTARNTGESIEFIQTDGTPELLAALAGYPGTIDDKLNRVTSISTPYSGGDQIERTRVDKYSLTGNLALGEHTLTSVTGYSDYSNPALSDFDSVPGDYAREELHEKGHQISQEVRLASPSGRRLEYLIGGLYLHGTLDNTEALYTNYPFDAAPGVPFAGAEATDFDQRTTDYSAFGQVTYEILDRLKATGGVRYTYEKKDVDLGRRILIPGFFSEAVFPPYDPFSLSRSERDTDYSFGLQYQASQTALFYASYGKGTKGGGFAQSVTLLDQAEYGREISRTEEVGVKLTDPGRKWIFDLSAFNTDVDGFQVVSFTGVQFIVVNTDLRSRGFELQTYWLPAPWLKLYVNNTYADAEDRHTHGPIPLAPKWTGSGGFNIDTPIGAGARFKLDGYVDWRSKRYYQQDPLTSPPSQSFVTYNASVAIADMSNKYELRLIGRNLTNADAIAFDFPTPFLPSGNQNATSERSRTIALQVSVKY